MASRKGRKSKGSARKAARKAAALRQPGRAAKERRQEEEQELPAAEEPEAAAEPASPVAAERDPFLLDTATKPVTVRNLKAAALRPLVARRFAWSEEIGPMFAVFAFAIMLYGMTTPRHVTLEDDGLFLMLLHHFGVGHPPGYPLYTLLGTPFYYLMPDFFPPAFRGHMFSGFMGALACVAVYAIVSMLVRSRVCALAAGIAYAASEAFWSQAIIAEVYALNAAMYFIVMAMCVRFAESDVGERKGFHLFLYCLIALTYGLALSNHWPLMGLGSIGLTMLVISQWRRLVSPRYLPLGGLFLAIGLLPYAYMTFRSHSETAINFYGPIEDLKALWFYVTRSGYSGVDNQEGVGLPEKVEFALFLANQLQRQITALGLAVAAVGFVAMLRSAVHSWMAASLAVAWFMSGPLMVIIIDFQTEFIWFSAFRVYHLLCYGITVIWFGYGLAFIGSWLARRWERLRLARVTVALGGLAVVALSVSAHWGQNDRSGYTYAHDLALFKLSQVEPNGKLFTFDDLDLPVGYLNLVEGVRPDVEVFNDQGLVFGRRIYSPFTPDDRKAIVIKDYIDEQLPTPVFYHPFRTKLFKNTVHGSDFLGFWRRVNQDGNEDRIILSDALFYWLQDGVEDLDTIVDRWTRQQARGIVATLIQAIIQAQQHGYELSPQWQGLIERAYEKNELVHLFVLWNRVFSQDVGREDAEAELAWIGGVFDNRADYIFDNSNLSDLVVLRSFMMCSHPELVDGDVDVEFERSMTEALDYEFKFATFRFLGDFYRSRSMHDVALDMLSERFPSLSTAELEFRNYHELLRREREVGRLIEQVVECAPEAAS